MPYDSRSAGSGGVSRPGSRSHLDVSTQADIAHAATTYESEDENMGRRKQSASSEQGKDRRTTLYSKQEFREQYCINSKQLDLLEIEKTRKDRFLGCLSQYHIESPCSRSTNKPSFLSVCVRRRVPSDENLNLDYAPIQRYPRYAPPSPAPSELYQYDEGLECSYFRRRPRSVCSQPDPKRYTWMPEDEDCRMEWPHSILGEDVRNWQQNYNTDHISSITRGGSLPRPLVHPCPAHPVLPPAPPPPAHGSLPHRTKHVSFARSHTLTTFDDAVVATSTAVPPPASMPTSLPTPPAQRYRSSPGERLLDGRTKPEQISTQQYAQYVMPLHQTTHSAGQDMLHSSGQRLVNTGGQGMVHSSGQGMVHSSGQGMVHSSGQGMVYPSSQGLIHKGGQNLVHSSGQSMVHASGQNMIHLSGQGVVQPSGQGVGAIMQQYGGPVPVHFPGLVQQPHQPVVAPASTSQQDHQLKVVNLEKIKRGPMRTQATQTEVCLGRKPLPPNYLSLSPRTIKRVKMVAQGVQTNGYTYGLNGRRLTKSFSEVGGDRLAGVAHVENNFTNEGNINEHDKLHRTQSEEPPRSPRSPDAAAVSSPLHFANDISTLDRSPVKLSPSTMGPPNRRKSINLPTTMNQQAHDYFHQNFQFIHESDRDDTMDDDIPQDMDVLDTSMALNQKNLEYLQKKIAEQSGLENIPRVDYSEKCALSKTTSSASQRTNYSTPFSKTSTFQSEISTETSATTTDDSEKEKEIIIDFEPRPENETPILKRRAQKRLLQKTLSEGEILLDIRKNEILKNSVYLDTVKDAPLVMSTSQDNITSSDKDLKHEYAFYQHAPIKDEGIFKETLDPNESFSSSDGNVPFEDFHERYISYKHDMFRNRSISLEEPSSKCTEKEEEIEGETAKSTPSSPQDLRQLKRSQKGGASPDEGDSVVPTSCLVPDERTSPFASSDSLTIDPTRDHSDGIWNESQATVLQVDSGTENGTVISSSELSSLAASVIISPGNLSLLTPNSRRKHLLLLQHQQRSSMDTDALDEEFDASQSQSPTSPRMKFDDTSSPHSSKPQSPPSSYLPQYAAARAVAKQPQAKLGNGTSVTKSAPSIAITHPSIDLGDFGVKRSMSIITKKRERALSPSRRKDLQKKTHDQNDPVVKSSESHTDGTPAPPPVTENGLARTDSGKTNTTDVSESTTTTTDDYVTANSDSSKRSVNKQPNHVTESRTQEGSSFESASSMYSLTRVEAMEDMVVPCFSPPLPTLTTMATCIASDTGDCAVTEIPEGLFHHSASITAVMAPYSCAAAAAATPVPPLPRSPRSPRPQQPGEDKDNSSAIQIPPTQNADNKVIACMTQSVGSSSSSGSYSLTGSAANILDEIKKEKSREHIKSPNEETTKGQRIVRAPIPEPDRQQSVPTMKGESVSDDERSAHYSSSGYYESPVEDDDDDGGLTYKHSQKYRSSSRPWTTDERRRKKKAFTLEISKSYDDSVSTSQDDWSRQSSKDIDVHSYRNERTKLNTKNSLDEKSNKNKNYKHQNHSEKSKSLHSSPRDHSNGGDIEKSAKEEGKRCNERYVKRNKLKSKSPPQNKTDSLPHARSQMSDSVRRHDALCTNGKVNLNIPTSDDSSEQYKTQGTSGNGNISPRKYRRLRESPRRKSGQTVQSNFKSPTTPNSHRSRKKNESIQSISLPGSLPRRKSSMQANAGTSSMEAEDIDTTRTLTSAGNRLTPLKCMKRQCTSPQQHRSRLNKGLAGETTGGGCVAAAARAKALSAESLRSVSPGSDSVFYSEAGAAGVAPCAHSHCLHCGKEVDIISADGSYGESQPDIVEPPAGFEDSPAARATQPHSRTPPPPRASGRYKKLEKRFRSEDKSQNDRRHHYRHRQEVRAKSEERSKEEETTKSDRGRIARSAGTGLDKLGPGDSTASIDNDDGSIDDGSGEGTDERGVYATPYWCGAWLYVADEDEFRAWQRHDREDETSMNSRCAEAGKGSGAGAGRGSASDSEADFARRYQALTLRLVHRKACVEMYRRQANGTFQSDKCVVVRRRGDEFGFRIHGSKPVVVSAIEADTPAETSGLEVGDIIIAVNGINVLDKSHSEVVKIAHAGSEILELEVARTCDVVASLAGDTGAPALFSGYLWRQVPAAPAPADGTPPAPRWHRRWFCLKRDNCLYYYKSDSSLQPVGALMLINYSVSRWPAEEAGRPHGLRVQRSGGAGLCLAADNEEAATRWLAVIGHAIEQSAQRDGWLDATIRHMKLPPSSVPRPDCFGYLMKLGSQWKSWSKRYCVLKDACLYFYHDATSKSAFGMACLHGYRVAACNPAGGGGKKHALELTPQQHKQRHFYFHAESDMDKKRWVAALEYSIDRWMKAS